MLHTHSLTDDTCGYDNDLVFSTSIVVNLFNCTNDEQFFHGAVTAVVLYFICFAIHFNRYLAFSRLFVMNVFT